MSEFKTELQNKLIELGFLAGPADGQWGRFSESSLLDYQAAKGEPVTRFNDIDEGYLSTISPPKLLNLVGGSLASAIALWYQKKGYHFAIAPNTYNICYLEGVDRDGTLNDDAPDEFNDARIVWRVQNGVPSIAGAWDGTCEPGWHYTINRMNPKGAARIQFGHYRAWEVGFHNNSQNHEALIQVGPITVVRDRDNSMTRNNGDLIDTGSGFFINQHSGFDNPRNLVGKASAGCLVGRTWEGHRSFMRLVNQDARYGAFSGYLFSTAIIPGNELHRAFPW
jgi:hypothetical protein